MEAINLPFPSWRIRRGLNKVAVSAKVGEGESLRKPSAAARARFLSACREESVLMRNAPKNPFFYIFIPLIPLDQPRGT